jgi:hypothetical protein
MNETLEQAAKEFANNSAITNYEEGINVGKYQGFKAGAKWQAKIAYTEQEVLHILDTLWDRLDLWYNRGMESDEVEFNLRKWFDECELKKKYER